MRKDLIEEIKRRIDLEQFISKYIPVKRGKASCPFHADKRPSLSIHSKKQIWKCWSCGENGDVFSFIQRIEGINFSNAVALLAFEVGLSFPKSERFKEYLSRKRKSRQKQLAHWRLCKWHLKQAEIAVYNGLRLKRKELLSKARWDSWGAKDYLEEQLIDYRFDALEERTRKIDVEMEKGRRRIVYG